MLLIVDDDRVINQIPLRLENGNKDANVMRENGLDN